MTEPDAPPPHDPAQFPPIEQRAIPELPPPEFQRSAGQPTQPPQVLAPLPPPYSPAHAAPPQPPYSPPPAAPQPHPFSPLSPTPAPPPFQPEPPVTPPPPPPPTSPPYYGGAAPTPAAAPAADGSGWAMAAHLTSLFGLGFSCFLVPLVGPLIVWLSSKDRYPEADWHGRESLNFQLNMLILWVVALPLYCLCCLGMVIHALQPIYMIILPIIASIQAANGKRFRYPFTLRLLND